MNDAKWIARQEAIRMMREQKAAARTEDHEICPPFIMMTEPMVERLVSSAA